MRKNIITIILSIALFAIGYQTSADFISWTLPKTTGLTYQVNTFGGQFKEMIGFSLTLALIPIAIALLWKHAPILKAQRRILSVVIIITSICISAFIRYLQVARDAAYLQQFSQQSLDGIQYTTSIPLESFNISTYMFFGLIAGSIISYFLLRDSKISKQ